MPKHTVELRDETDRVFKVNENLSSDAQRTIKIKVVTEGGVKKHVLEIAEGTTLTKLPLKGVKIPPDIGDEI
ncbi:hypothetical protein [Paraflavitalea sp. CAU 1676]|uniref:hypothetical protein n=1 Tax=Paraflavitalea sp. CAU 1676 TaxID=3032598 RepID=UPI0023DB8C24|nr:hypothetical protein [Paraflavitalea sp. CAU 1676]MDF2186987.1 hypothetical protein [Paraflavitalea sp. CAU 1676]